jgi:uncharacterized protein YndB with AHSA1/START domain
MDKLEQFFMEFHIETTPKLLFTLISTAEGLTRWFANTLQKGEDTYVFQWPGNEQITRLVQVKDSEYVVFKWLEDYHQDLDLEMRIEADPNTSGVTLVITDFAEQDDVDFSKRWWEIQVGKLQKLFNN